MFNKIKNDPYVIKPIIGISALILFLLALNWGFNWISAPNDIKVFYGVIVLIVSPLLWFLVSFNIETITSYVIKQLNK